MELYKEFKTLNSSIEHNDICESFELDFQENLPQYLDDIEKVIKCTVKSIVTDYECNSNAVKIYGKSLISVTYLNSQGHILSNVFEEEFSKQFNTNDNFTSNYANIKITSKYSSFRLINQRRIDVHTSLKAYITAFSIEDDDCLCECKNAFIKKTGPSLLIEKASGICSEEFDETFSVANSDTQIRNIANSFVSCIVEDKKIIKDKMLVKLRVELSVLYEGENMKLEKSIHTFSLNKIIDIINADDSDICFVNASVSSIYLKAKSDNANKLCDIEAVGRITFNYSLMSVVNDEFIVDSYIPDYNCELMTKNIDIKINPIYYYDDKSCELQFDLENNIVDVVDLNALIVDCTVEKSDLIINVKINMLYYDESSSLCFYENTNAYTLKLNDNHFSGTANVNLLSFDYVIKNASTINLRINFEYCAYLYEQKSFNIIKDINVTSQRDSSDLPQLILYFAQKDENVWDIAKKFSTAMSLIIDENDLAGEVIDCQRVILVPRM